MTTEQQNKAWACLPKEVRDEIVSTYFCKGESCQEFNRGYIAGLIGIFGHHNLTSDTEPEEMLITSREEVRKAYQERASACAILDESDKYYVIYSSEMRLLRSLFGSKCLPDLEEKPKPKLKVGDKVTPIKGNPDYIGKIAEVLSINEPFASIVFDNGEQFSYSVSFLEPYTEEKKDMTEKELNLCELLKGCEGEKLYSPYIGECRLTEIKPDEDHSIWIRNSDDVWVALPSCGHEPDGVVMLYPSRALYEKYPLDAAKAWSEWAESRDPKRWRAKEGKNIGSLIWR